MVEMWWRYGGDIATSARRRMASPSRWSSATSCVRVRSRVRVRVRDRLRVIARASVRPSRYPLPWHLGPDVMLRPRLTDAHLGLGLELGLG
jgi:hypothetical protein